MATFDPHKNFAISTVATAPSPALSGTSLVVATGDGTKFPAASFNAVVWPTGAKPLSSNSEIVRVTNVSTDTFTITRTQESSSSRTIVVGDQIMAAMTSKIFTDIEALFPTGSVVGTTDSQTVSAKVLSNTFMGKEFDTRVTAQSTTLEASLDYFVDDLLEIAATHTLELPATSTLETTVYSTAPKSEILTNKTLTSSTNAIITGTATAAAVATSETTTSVTYADLATTTDTVTLTTGTRALVVISGRLANNTLNNEAYMGFAVSGATTITAADTSAISMQAYTSGAVMTIGSAFVVTLTAGSNTFKAKYRVSGGTGTFSNRSIAVIPL